jgi:hypothetical protein
MHIAHLPFIILPTHQARNALGASLGKAAVLALRAILTHRKSLELAHQQIRYGKHHLAFSSRVGNRGDLILEIDLGDPDLCKRLFTEDELRRAAQQRREKRKSARRARPSTQPPGRRRMVAAISPSARIDEWTPRP